jgi:hypothetical protein
MNYENSSSGIQKTLLCFIDGFDFNRINPENTPFMSRSISKYPYARITSPPTTDHMPTILTGKHLHEHKIFHVILKTDSSRTNVFKRLYELLPDSVTTTLQCFLYLISNSYELPRIPPKRRKQFRIVRTKSFRQKNNFNAMLKINNIETIFNYIGKEKCSYFHTTTSNLEKKFLSKVGRGDHVLEFLEIYSLDLVHQWNMNKPAIVDNFYRDTDLFLNNLNEKCNKNGVTLILLSDHGQDEIIGTIDILNSLKNSGLQEDDYSYFIQASMARFWFHNNFARNSALKVFEDINTISSFTWQELDKFNIAFPDSRYGEVFCMTKPGYIFFPDDFVQRVADLVLGLLDKKQRARIFDPKFRGNHTFLKEYDSSKGFLTIFDDNCKVINSDIDIVDVAPSLLHFMGYEIPKTMSGNPVFISA